MNRKFNKTASIILLLVFLLPSIIKLEHHHKHFISLSKQEKPNLVFHDNCSICNFEFSIFISCINNIDLQIENPPDSYSNNYISQYNSNLSLYSFLLRAPPGKQIWNETAIVLIFKNLLNIKNVIKWKYYWPFV